ncbi:MAG: rane fusion protein heavy metal efflux system [Gammaproteobacteria bacterium]|jgi:cobalt-zinc-cadmium efflux system membrane fusion protein|nr:rane fusion protein heavy metal efflux system [Gammaproteobacteria bacterium]
MHNRSFEGMSRRRQCREFGLFLAAALITAGGLSGCSGKAAETHSAAPTDLGNVRLSDAQRGHIQIFEVQSAAFHRTIEATGVVDFDNDQSTSVLAPFSGPVSRLLVPLGQQVKKGDALAAVESPDFATAISGYQKALSTAQTNRKLADLDQDLLTHNGVAQREAAQAETDAANAEADRDAALQELVSLQVPAAAIKEIQAGRKVARVEGMIRAPVAGTVVERLVTPGQLLQAGETPCFTVANLSRVWVMAQVFGADLGAVSVGDAAQVNSGAGSKGFSGKVDNIAALVDPGTRAVAVRVVVDNPGDLLKKQMYVRVRLQSRQESRGMLIPASAILRDDENLPFVYQLQTDGSLARQHVTLGSRTGDAYDIAEGLSAGDKIVVDGALFIQFMQNQ